MVDARTRVHRLGGQRYLPPAGRLRRRGLRVATLAGCAFWSQARHARAAGAGWWLPRRACGLAVEYRGRLLREHPRQVTTVDVPASPPDLVVALERAPVSPQGGPIMLTYHDIGANPSPIRSLRRSSRARCGSSGTPAGPPPVMTSWRPGCGVCRSHRTPSSSPPTTTRHRTATGRPFAGRQARCAVTTVAFAPSAAT
jgi:hypothetical protein